MHQHEWQGKIHQPQAKKVWDTFLVYSPKPTKSSTKKFLAIKHSCSLQPFSLHTEITSPSKLPPPVILSNWEAKEGGLQVPGQSWQFIETLSQTEQNEKPRNQRVRILCQVQLTYHSLEKKSQNKPLFFIALKKKKKKKRIHLRFPVEIQNCSEPFTLSELRPIWKRQQS